jgi:hypothetical protein
MPSVLVRLATLGRLQWAACVDSKGEIGNAHTVPGDEDFLRSGKEI